MNNDKVTQVVDFLNKKATELTAVVDKFRHDFSKLSLEKIDSYGLFSDALVCELVSKALNDVSLKLLPFDSDEETLRVLDEEIETGTNLEDFPYSIQQRKYVVRVSILKECKKTVFTV